MKDPLVAPDALENVKEVKHSYEIEDFVTEISKEVKECEQDRSEWNNRQDDYEKKRYGIRSKRTFPWLGAANFVLPQIDSDINRQKPAYISLFSGVSPVVLYEPFGGEDVEPARKRERLFDWRLRNQVKFFQPYALGIDYALSRGFTIFRTGWKFKTRTYIKYLNLQDLNQEVLDAIFMPEITDEILFAIIAEAMKPDLKFQENMDSINKAIKQFRDGKTEFEFEFLETVENCPDVKALDPRDEVTFPVGTSDIQKAYFIDYKFWVTKNEIKQAMAAGQYTKYSDDEIETWETNRYSTTDPNSVKATRDGVRLGYQDDDMICLHETCTWYDINGDGIDERVIVTYPDSNPSEYLRFIESPYDHGQFPYVVVRREINDAEILSSRGIPALDDDFQTGISTLFNQDIDHGTIMNTPTVVARRNSVKNLRNLRYVPGQVVETENGTADYSVVQNSNMGQANKFNSMQYLKSWANDRIGNLTAAISQANNAPGQGQQGEKTAREVGAIESASSQLLSMDLLVWQVQMADLYYQIDSLYEQFGDEDEYEFVTNEKLYRMSRQEIQGRFNMVPNGRLDNSNTTMRYQKALTIYQMFGQDPDFKAYELKRYVMDELDARLSSRFMLTPEEIQMRNAQMAQQQAVNESAELQKQMGIRKISDSMELEKEWKMSKIQGRKYAED